MSFLSQITPVILTFNEEANIGRCLANLDWASDIVVVDSHSTDRTREICAANPRVRLFERAFDSHAGQWTYAAKETGVTTPWVLALDCDYMVTPQARAEMAALPAEPAVNAYWFSFRYAVMGKVLKSGIYPPVQALYRQSATHYVQDGHTHRAVVDGPTAQLRSVLIHDDRKPLDHWLKSQLRYARLEAEKLAGGQTGMRAWLRTRTPFAPLLVGAYCLIGRGALFEGPAGWLYAAQRMLAEAMIATHYWWAKTDKA